MATQLKPEVSPVETAPNLQDVSKIDSKGESALEHEVGYKEYLEGRDLVVSDKESRWVRTKIDLVILPMFLITQMLQFLDRTALNYANLFDYQEALGLEGYDFNWLSAMVFAGYFVGQYPCGWLIGRFKAQRVLAIACFFWSLMVLMMTQAKSFSSAMALRFIMGLFEGALTPSLTLMTGWWYQRREIPLRQCIWYSSLGLGGIVGSYISMGISTLPEDSTPARWEILFYILGGVTMLWSIIIYVFLPDAPSNARFLNERQRLIAVKRVVSNEMGIKNKEFKKKQALLAFYDPKMILIWVSVFAAAIPNGVINSFSTIIIEDLGFSTTRTTELKSVGDAIQVTALLIAGIITLNIPNTRLIVATVANVLCTTCAACMAYLPRSNTWGRLVCFWLVNSQSVGFTVSLITISSNMGGYSHRSMASALVL